MTRLTHRLHRIGLAVLIGLGFAAATSAQPALEDRLGRITSSIDLEADQQAALTSISSRYADADGAALWTAAAEVRDVLTAEQLQQLRTAGESRRADRGDRGSHSEARGRRGRADRGRGGRARGDRQGQGRRGRDRQGEGHAQLTDDQRQSLREIRTEAREQQSDLVEQLRDGRISDDAFVSQTEAIRSSSRARMADVMPGEVSTRLDERSSRREAAKQSREAALGLTADQKARLQTLRLDRIRNRPEALDMRPYLDADGQLDRSAFRAAQHERREAQRSVLEAAREARDEVYTETQRDLLAVHRALSGPRGRGTRGRRGNRGHRGR